MPLLFTCPHCQTQTLVETQYAGQAGACAACGKPITVPDFQEETGSIAMEPRKSIGRPIRLIATICVAAVVVLAGGMLMFRYGVSGIAQIRANSLRGACRNNVRLIAAALNAYADDYGTYPTPMVTDAAGKPMYSWRVLILPYLGHQSLYDQFNLAEPWSSETNMALAYSRPAEYGSPAVGSNVWSEPNYMLITGPGTLFPASGPLSPRDVIDRPDQTLLVVEVARPANPMAGNELLWTQPADLDVAKMVPAINGKDGVEIGGNHEGGATAATSDGRDHFLSESLSAGEIRGLITPRGGEPLPDDLLDDWE
ncbi:DUF1559 domain-containing protein [Rosistilla oblonga]|uniref:DUF1559 domain-containing protein n=1 Tax=Rosistilla oblonga TaxID=2527990 RepID=A0A518IN76_9BACT|nr:DUF1559 domain-containing protein [Rosistilla oblonga]QDV54534.1 hypothetical protein Mal33_04890 [Rosistilla oblonga]